MAGADFAEFVGYGLLGEFGPVAIAAEMGQEHMAEPVAGDIAGERGGGIIAEVAVTAHDALLQRPGARGVFLKKFQVVIGFDDERIHLADAFRDELGHVTEIGQHADRHAGAGLANDIADGIVGIVGYAERFHEEIADLERTARGKQAPGNADGRRPLGIGGDGFGGETIGVNGDGTRFAEHAKTADVIGMFVGKDDAADLVDVAIDEREAMGDLAGAEPGVDEEPGRVGFNQAAITGAAAAQNRDVHPHEER